MKKNGKRKRRLGNRDTMRREYDFPKLYVGLRPHDMRKVRT